MLKVNINQSVSLQTFQKVNFKACTKNYTILRVRTTKPNKSLKRFKHLKKLHNTESTQKKLWKKTLSYVLKYLIKKSSLVT